MSAGKAIVIFFVFYASLSAPCALFSAGILQFEPKVVTELQDRYNALVAPGVVMFPAGGTSAVSADLLFKLDKELHKQLVNTGKMRPVSMNQWLQETYGGNKVDNPFLLMNGITAEQYVQPLGYIAQPTVFRDGQDYYFLLYLYSLENYYPITVFRKFTVSTHADMISSCIEEMNTRLFPPPVRGIKKRVVIDDFNLEFYQLVQIGSGEFDFVSTPFVEENKVVFRQGDDFFKRILGYALETTNLFQVMPAGDFKAYSNTAIPRTTTVVDYRIQGRVLLSSNESLLSVNLTDVRSGASILELRYVLNKYSFEGVWRAYRTLALRMVETLFSAEQYGVVPMIQSSGKSFFANNMYVGQNTLEYFVLPRGSHIISTGTPYRMEQNSQSVNLFYTILESENNVYTGTAGRRIWNLLHK